MTTRLHTQDAMHHLDGLSSTQRSIRLILADKLTEVQNRRMTLLFGLDGGPGLGVREAARAEGVRLFAVQKSAEGAVARLVNDWRLWGYWLLQGEGVVDSYMTEDGGATSATWEDATPAELGYDGGVHAMEPFRGRDGWETDRYNRPPNLAEVRASGWLAYGEGRTVEDNPHTASYAEQRATWLNGWAEAAARAGDYFALKTYALTQGSNGKMDESKVAQDAYTAGFAAYLDFVAGGDVEDGKDIWTPRKNPYRSKEARRAFREGWHDAGIRDAFGT